MFKIARITKQISNASQIIKKATTSISSMFQNLTQDKGYMKDVSDELTFAKALPVITHKQSLIQDTLSAWHFAAQDVEGSQSSINRLEIRKLIYQRFADEINAGNKCIQDDIIKYSPAKSVNEELESIKEQGYSFTKQKIALKRSITDKWDEIERINYLSKDAVWGIKEQQKSLSQDDSIVGRMKSLSIKGYLSNYSGDTELSQSINSVIKIKDTMITEFMQKVYDKHMNTTESHQSTAEVITFDALINGQEVSILGE